MNYDLFADFLHKTELDQISPSAQSEGALQPPLELPYPPEAPLIDLPEPLAIALPQMSLREAIDTRRTLRRYTEASLSLVELSYLLWCTQGVKKVTERPVTLRTVPSAGARHAFETYLLVNKVDGLEPGLYRFIALEHALLRLPAGAEIAKRLTEACLGQSQIETSAVTFIWVAVTERMAWRYCERSLRYLFLDAGHVCQNLYLAAESIKCGACAIDAYDDASVNHLLGLDGVQQFAIYMGALGKR
jgi:SagB-type dehydrogenase family enzyme